MQKREWTTVDKSAWPRRGVWDTEPDKAQWLDRGTGFPCLAVRGPGGHFCGYVGVPKGHPLYAVSYMDEGVADVAVHGGLTYSLGRMQHAGEDGSTGIYCVTEPGDPESIWWFGFDCAHCGDLCPSWDIWNGVYRELGYVKDGCERLAFQLFMRA